MEFQKGKKGKNVRLTIDSKVQELTSELLKDKAGSICVMDIFTGSIVAMNSSPSFDPNSFVFGIILSFVLSFLLSKIYEKHSNSFSNPQTLSRIFPILSIGTTIIIAVVKSSLALSLGLVGALSIVRFRNPVKSPFELVMFFALLTLGITASVSIKWLALLVVVILTVIILIEIIQYFKNYVRSYKCKKTNIHCRVD